MDARRPWPIVLLIRSDITSSSSLLARTRCWRCADDSAPGVPPQAAVTAAGQGHQARRRVHRGGLATGARRHRLHAARSERRRRRPPTRPKRGSPTTRHRIYIAVHRARPRAGHGSSASAPAATSDSPSDWMRVIDRFVPRPPHRVRVRRQSGRREAGPLLVQRQQRRQGWDAVWDVAVSRGERRLARRVPHSVLAAALPSAETHDVRLRGRRGRSAG